MYSNASLDFLEMLKNSKTKEPDTSKLKASESKPKNQNTREIKANGSKAKEIGSSQLITVIDTETNWHDEVMSIGVALADADSFKCVDTRYYIIDPEYRIGGIYSNVLHYNNSEEIGNGEIVCSRSEALNDIVQFLENNNISKIFAYNAKFDYSHLRELSAFK